MLPAEAELLRRGTVIPAHPLALAEDRSLDERRQRALTRYYLAAGAGGIAVGVHTTQFGIRDPDIGLLGPVLELAAAEVREWRRSAGRPVVLVAGVCGRTDQALDEARLASDLGYDVVMPHLGAFANATDQEMLSHCRSLAELRPLFGFYLQPAVGGRRLDYKFWRRFVEIENVAAIKIAPFNRYETLDVVRAVVDAGKAGSIALYTGNDDHIVLDLLAPFRWTVRGRVVTAKIVGGLLGHWAVWTRSAVKLMEEIQAIHASDTGIPADMLARANEVTDVNAALFDPAHNFSGSISGIHEILRRQGLMQGRWTLDPAEDLSPGQMNEIDRVCAAYPDLNDDEFVAAHIDDWLR
jgi:dihydrodipicolinate synthase/N-acetylneuraminate lyase